MTHSGKLLPLSIAASILSLFIYACWMYFPPVSQSQPISDGLRETIAAREYHISYDSTRHQHQSPNRQQNLRARYRPGHLAIHNRVDSSYLLVLRNEGISADGAILDRPDPGAKAEISENKLLLRHSKFTEEFINSEAGVRQNFIIHEAPASTSELKVQLSADGLRVENGAKNELLFFDELKKHPLLLYRDLRCWDAKNRPLTAHLSSEGQQISITVDVRNASYPVTIDPIVVNGNPGNADALLESNQADAWLGYSVSSAGDVNGDGYSDVLAGAPDYDNGEDGEGAAFLFYGSANGVNPVPTILESNQAHAKLGFVLCGAGDLNGDGFSDIALGAPHCDKGQPEEGAVFIHLGSAKGIKPNAVVVLEGNQMGAHFGTSVALGGDVNGDGHSDLVVGASDYDQGQLNEGAAFVFFGTKTGIDPNKVAMLETNQAMAKTGTTVAGAGDVNGDGFSDVLVGAPFYDQGEVNEGAAFLYLGNIQGISQVPTVVQSNQAEAHSGLALSSAGDLNGDGYADIIIGAPHYDKQYADQGLVRIYLGSANGIQVNAPITLVGSQMNEEFGRSVGCAGDVQGDGYADILVASRFQAKNLADEGVVMLYAGASVGIIKKPVSGFKSNQSQALLGQSVASAGDVNGDGFSDIILGAHRYDEGQKDEGAAMIWHGGAAGLSARAALTSSQPEAWFGYAVSGAGDVNGDGFDDVLVGAPRYDNGETDEGAAFLFLGTASGLSKTAATVLESNQAESGFGTSVSTAGDVNGDGYADSLIGAPHFDNGEDEEGAAFFYAGSAAGLVANPVQLEGNLAGSWFGNAVSHAGDLNADGYGDILIGAMNYSNGEVNEGACYVVPGSAGGPDMAGKRIIEANMEDARLGNAVSAAGDLNGDGRDDVVIGAYSVGDYDSGAIWVGYGKADSVEVATIKGVHEQAHFGWDVAGAGDVNGDGFGDLVVGAHGYNNGDGAAYVYYGSAAGITALNVFEMNSHETGMAAAMGESVTGAGDLNGDGYGDIAVGEPWFVEQNTSMQTGLTMIYYGSPTGIGTSPQRIVGNLNDEFDFFGYSVAPGGDVNGDGYSDLLVGSPNFSSVQSDGDAAFVYFGNGGGGLRNNVRLYNSDLTTLINQTQKSKNDFGIGILAHFFLGRNQGKLVWESAGQAFAAASNGLLSNSTYFNGFQKGFSSISNGGTELKSKVTKLGLKTNIRTRVRFSPTLALTGQMFGPWRYAPGMFSGNTTTPAPLNDVAKPYVYPNPVSSLLRIHPGDRAGITKVVLTSKEGRFSHPFPPARDIDLKGIPAGHYILNIQYSDATTSRHSVIIR